MDSCIMDRASIGTTPLEAAAKALRICDELIEDGSCNHSLANAVSDASNLTTAGGALQNARAYYLAKALEERLTDVALIGQLREALATLHRSLAQHAGAAQ